VAWYVVWADHPIKCLAIDDEDVVDPRTVVAGPYPDDAMASSVCEDLAAQWGVPAFEDLDLAMG